MNETLLDTVQVGLSAGLQCARACSLNTHYHERVLGEAGTALAELRNDARRMSDLQWLVRHWFHWTDADGEQRKVGDLFNEAVGSLGVDPAVLVKQLREIGPKEDR